MSIASKIFLPFIPIALLGFIYSSVVDINLGSKIFMASIGLPVAIMTLLTWHPNAAKMGIKPKWGSRLCSLVFSFLFFNVMLNLWRGTEPSEKLMNYGFIAFALCIVFSNYEYKKGNQ